MEYRVLLRVVNLLRGWLCLVTGRNVYGGDVLARTRAWHPSARSMALLSRREK